MGFTNFMIRNVNGEGPGIPDFASSLSCRRGKLNEEISYQNVLKFLKHGSIVNYETNKLKYVVYVI